MGERRETVLTTAFVQTRASSGERIVSNVGGWRSEGKKVKRNVRTKWTDR